MRRDGDDGDTDAAAHEPLISRNSRDDAGPSHHPASTSPARTPRVPTTGGSPTTPITLRNAGPIVRFLTLSAGISGLLFGFDTGVISSTLVTIGSDLSHRPLTTADKSLITAITSLLALISAPLTGVFADRYGRKSVILVPAFLFVLGALVQAFAKEVWVMVAGRGLVGAAVGVASGAVPLYITELAPAELRGRLVTVQSMFITGGQVVAYLIGWGFAYMPGGWRLMVGSGAVPALLQLVLIVWMPETPRWLLQTGKDDRARAVLMSVYAALPEGEKETVVQSVLVSVRTEIMAENKAYSRDDTASGNGALQDAVKDLLMVPGNRRALTIACMLQGLQQLCGFNSLMYFSATIFSLVGFNSPVGTSLSVATTNFIFTVVAFNVIDLVGRRNLLLRSIPFMVLGLALCAVSFSFIDIGDSTVNGDVYNPKASSIWSMVLLVSMIFFVAAYAIGLGVVPWQQSELFPLRVRSLGSGLATATNWSSNFIIGMTFLPMMGYLGASTTFAFYALICVVGWILIWRIYPETAGLELEDMGDLLRDGFGVNRSVQEFRERREERIEQDRLG